MTEHSDAGLEACFELDPSRQRIADSAFGELHMPECVRLRLAGGLLLELGDMRAFRDHDDAEELALAAPPIQMADDIAQRERELGDDDQVGAAAHAAEKAHPPAIPTHHLTHHHPLLSRLTRV